MTTCLLSFLMVGALSSVNVQQGTELVVCDLQVPKSIKQAHASFTVTYSFELDNDGNPTNVKRVVDRYASKEDVEACITSWRFHGLPSGEKLVATIRWQHGKGWVEITVVGRNFKQVVRIPKGVGY